MTNYIAEDVASIAQRLKEIEQEKDLARKRSDTAEGVVLPITDQAPQPEPGHYSYY